MNESVNARIAGCNLTTSVGIIFFSFIHTVSHILGYLKDSNAAVHSVDGGIFALIHLIGCSMTYIKHSFLK